MSEERNQSDLVDFAQSRGGRLLSEAYGGWGHPHRWVCGREHAFEASPRLLIDGGYWCPECLPTVDDASGWDWDFHAEVDPLLARFHRSRRASS